MRSFKNYITEAIAHKNMVKATQIILKYLEKKLGPVFEMPGIEEFEKSDGGKGFGLRYFWGKNSFRFNWLRNSTSSEISSFDIWKAKGGDPTITVETNGVSLVRISSTPC